MHEAALEEDTFPAAEEGVRPRHLLWRRIVAGGMVFVFTLTIAALGVLVCAL